MGEREHDSHCFLLDFFLISFSLLTYLMDMILSGFLVHKFFREASYTLAAVVGSMLVTSGLITSGMSCYWLEMNPSTVANIGLPIFLRIFRILANIFLVGPISGYINALFFLLKRYLALKKMEFGAVQRIWGMMVLCVEEVAVLRLFQTFIHAAPQLVIQLYTMIQQLRANHIPGWLELMTATSLIVSISMSLTTYDRSERLKSQKEALGFRAITIEFFAHIFNIVARVQVIGLFASLSIQYAMIAMTIHWMVMVCWLLLPIIQSYWCCRIGKILQSLALATAYIFIFINPHDDSRTRHKYIFFYTMCLVENSAMMVMWYKHGDFSISWLYYLGLIGHYVFFVSGIILLVFYYVKCHPKLNRLELLDEVALDEASASRNDEG